jgi:putative SOS response-associated peptidase YedK
MCGRFTNRLTWREIIALYRLSVPATPERNLPARYNICPTDTIDTVVEEDGAGSVPARGGKRAIRVGKKVPPSERSAHSVTNQYRGFRVRQHLVCNTAEHNGG